jgi:hypothetical protein
LTTSAVAGVVVEAEDRLRSLDIAAQPDRGVVDAQEREHRRAAACTAIGGEGLHVASLGEEGVGKQVAGGLGALPTAPLDDDLQHRLFSSATAGPGDHDSTTRRARRIVVVVGCRAGGSPDGTDRPWIRRVALVVPPRLVGPASLLGAVPGRPARARPLMQVIIFTLT